MKVRVIRDCYLGPGKGRGFRKEGVEFDYDGPPNVNLAPVGFEQELEVPTGAPDAETGQPKPASKKKKKRVARTQTP